MHPIFGRKSPGKGIGIRILEAQVSPGKNSGEKGVCGGQPPATHTFFATILYDGTNFFELRYGPLTSRRNN